MGEVSFDKGRSFRFTLNRRNGNWLGIAFLSCGLATIKVEQLCCLPFADTGQSNIRFHTRNKTSCLFETVLVEELVKRNVLCCG